MEEFFEPREAHSANTLILPLKPTISNTDLFVGSFLYDFLSPLEQIEEFNLEHLQNPDPETLHKVEGGYRDGKRKKGDSNTEWFKKYFGEGRVFQIEIDAMQARREQFRDHLLNTIDSKFDKTIYKRDINALKSAQNSIRELLKEAVNDLEYDWVS